MNKPTEQRQGAAALQLWGGVECTVNRVGDRWLSQMSRNGHATRIADLDRFAELGIRALRYPVLWELVAPDALERCDWSWPDARLTRIRDLGIMPIVGLVHHGSGPAYTSLVDPQFPGKLAIYASAVARRYPWVDHYTPVNEPLTTARFSGLYGFWYPHGRDERIFKDALLNQCRGVVLAMRSIREVNPQARLVQTEDLGKTYSTPALAYQARFQNELRWLCWDLLDGRLDRHHPLWSWLVEDCGASEQELMWFADNRCSPDIIGVNHYVTSERFLDPELAAYPSRCHGGNRLERYADVEAARCVATPTDGIESLLLDVWSRYRIPLAITEAHIDSTRDDQLRWLARIWRAAEAARRAGADVRAVTAWALLGSYDWNCLLTECNGYYEVGAFDVRGPQPRETAIGNMMRSLAHGKIPDLPVLARPGWWQRPDRFLGRPVGLDGAAIDAGALATGGALAAAVGTVPNGAETVAPILITGATGTLGRAFARICAERGIDCRLVTRQELDIADADSIARALDRYQPWAVINTAGYVRVDDAEQDVERCFRENADGAGMLAAACARHAVPLVTFSSDMVFDGNGQQPYVESDLPAPLNVYGRSKAHAEQLVLDCHPKSLVVRTSSFFGPWDDCNYLTVLLRTLGERRSFAAASDLTVSPTYVPDLVHACLDLLLDRATGIWHLTNGGEITWADLALRATRMAGLDSNGVVPCRCASLAYAARRPVYSALGSDRTAVMPPLDSALERYVHHYRTQRTVASQAS